MRGVSVFHEKQERHGKDFFKASGAYDCGARLLFPKYLKKNKLRGIIYAEKLLCKQAFLLMVLYKQKDLHMVL